MLCTSGSITTNPDDWAKRSFQTPLPGDFYYRDTYQNLGRIMCYPLIQYAQDRQSASVEVVCKKHESITKV